MIRTFVQTPSRWSLALLALPLLLGGSAALLPWQVSLAVLVVVVLAVLWQITPLAGFTVMLMLSPLRTLIATESALRLPLDIGQITFLLFVAGWAVYRIARKQSLLSLRWTPIYIPILLFTIAGGLTVFSAVSLSAWLTEWLKWLIILSMIVLVLDIGTGERWQWVMFALVMAGVANALVGLYTFVGGSGADHLVIGELRRYGVFFRAFGTFGQPNPFAGFLGLLTPLAIMASYGYGVRIWQRWRYTRNFSVAPLLPLVFYSLATLMMLMGIFASWSRGAWLGIVAALGVTMFALPRRIWLSLLLVISGAGLLGGLWFGGLLPASIVARISSSAGEFFAFEDVRGVDIDPANYAVVERLAHWQAALNIARDHSLLGVGLGNYEVVYEQYRLINWKFPLGHAHNYYLNILAEAGMIGFLAYGGMWLLIFWQTWRVRQHPDPLCRAVAVGLLGTWTYLAVHSLLDNLYVNNVFLHLGALFGVLALIHHQIRSAHIWELK